MARARNIKPGFYKNEDLAECSIWARYIFPGLWMLADREGRLEDRPKRIKGELLAFDSQEVEPLLCELVRFGFIERYESDGLKIIQIMKFKDHQSPHFSEKPSELPERFPESHPLEEGKFPESPYVKEGAKRKNSERKQVLKRGSQPPDSLNPDSLNPDSLNPEHRAGDSSTVAAPETAESAPPTTPPADPPEAVEPTPQGLACKAMRQAGIAVTNPQHPTLIALIDAGATADEFREAARESVTKGKPSFAYALGIVRSRREEAAQLVLHQGRLPNKQEALEASNRAATAGWVPPELREKTA
jgi:hypothetical protein